MNVQFNKLRAAQLFAFIFSLFVILTTFGCQQPTPTTSNAKLSVNTSAINSANTSITNTTQNNSSQNKNLATQMPVTLPVLDAMFSDENFAADLKSKLQLTDEQIDKLKNISHQAVASLKETDDDSSGSTRASIDRASKQIKDILGENDSEKFFDFVRQRWSGGVDEANNNSGNGDNNASTNANPVPTDTRIVVNAPEYRMDVFQDGKLIKSYKVGIGYPEFPLPSGMRKASEIIFNPTWTPPDEPWVEGSNKVKAGETVKAGDKLNPLGPIKIPIGLPSLIHGGKNPAKLGTFASHGCVGLTDKQVQDFALEIAGISGTELTKDDVADYAKQKTETKNVKLGKPIPVELRYQTIVVEDGKLKIFRDVYEKGTNTEENLRKVLESYGVSFDNLNQQDQQKILDGLKQMAIDATGNPVEPNANTNSSNSNSEAKTNSNNSNSKNVPITRTIKGKKEVEFDLAELKGKGYPAPVDLNSGK